MNKKIFSILLIVTLVLTACSGGKDSSPAEGLEKTSVILDWTPNTNHTGLYVALENGYYEEEGLDVKISQPTDGTSNTLIATGKGDFGVSYQEDLTYALSTDDPLPIKAIAAIIQNNTSGFAARKTAGITSVKDFEDKSYGGWGSPSEKAVLKTVMEKAGADVEKVKMIDLGVDDFFAATEKNIDFIWIFEAWTGIEARLKGVDIDYIAVKDLDPNLNYYTPILVTSNEIINKEPEKAEKFMRATTRGYEFAIENPEEAGRILLKHAPELDEELVIESQKFLKDQYKLGAEAWGEMKEEVWDNYTNFMRDNGLLENDLDIKDAYTNEFILK